MPDINIAVQDLIEEMLEWYEECPIPMDMSAIYHDALYEQCYEEVMSQLTAEAENRREEEKYND